MMLRNILIGVALLSITYSCLEPYSLHIDGYDNLLVVDALITDENASHTVVLRRSVSDINESSPYESGAVVYVTDTNGASYYFAEFGPGTYKSDSTDFIANDGDKFVLHIQTANGEQYESDQCELLTKTSIDDLYFAKNTNWDESGENQNEGISIYADGSANQSGYVRWMYKEDWEFQTPYPERYAWDGDLVPLSVENWFCWKTFNSNNIHVHSFGNQVSSEIKKEEICFIPTGLNDKLNIRYSILVKQLSISKEEYEFWRKLSESTEDVGDVFGKQPFSIVGNVKNITNNDEPVLGYFQVGAIADKRMYISFSDLNGMNLPYKSINDECNLDTFVVDGISFFSVDQIYEDKVVNGPYKFFEPVYDDMGMSVRGMLLSTPLCSDCSLKGSTSPPAFWEE
nr:DUF4249 domain-containing protein [uncultured Carboxylicivirga sp.]